MKTNFEKVREFMTAFGQETPTFPTLPDMNTVMLRYSLIQEEFGELEDGIKNEDIVEIADALVDILYVTYGALVAFGLPGDILFEEVQRSNMSKLDENGNPIYRTDGKILKGPNYSPPDLKSIIEQKKGP